MNSLIKKIVIIIVCTVLFCFLILSLFTANPFWIFIVMLGMYFLWHNLDKFV